MAFIQKEANISAICTYEQANSTFGTCDVPKISPPPPAALSSEGSSTSPAQVPSGVASLDSKPVHLQWFCGTMLATILLFWL